MNNRLYALDGLRGIAAFAVLIFHVTNKQFAYGHYGVQLFFIISGFVIFLSTNNIKTVKEFIVKRVLRLFPAFIVCMTITTIVINLLPEYAHDSIDVKRYICNLSMIPEILGVKPVDNSYWSLVPELFFYALIAFVLYFKQMKHILWICIIWLIIISINILFKIDNQYQIIKLFNIRHGQLFIAGIMLYKIYKEGFNINNTFMLSISYVLTIIIYPLAHPHMYFWSSHIIITTIIYVLFLLFIFDKLIILQYQPFQFLGKISYSLYLIHQIVGITLINYFKANTQFNTFFIIIFVVLLLIITSYAIYKYIELPPLKLRNRILKKET